MSELQNDSEAVTEDNVTAEAVENPETGSDLAPDSQGQDEQTPQAESTVNQEAINKVINRKHFEAQQAKRELEEAQAKIAEFEKAKAEQEAAQVGNIPPRPEQYDDDFEQKLNAREDALLRKAQHDAQQTLAQQQQAEQLKQQELAQQQEQAKQNQAFMDRASELGIDHNVVNAAATTLVNHGISAELGSAIIADSDGPLIAQHLAANPLEVYELSQMNPILAGAKFAEIKAKAAALKPKTSSAPEPATNLSGGTADPEVGRYKNIRGAKFE